MKILNASGCLDALTVPGIASLLDAYVTKTVTPQPRAGNAPVRIAETDTGMLNSIGLANPGIDAFLARTLPRLAEEVPIPVWVSVGGFCADDYARCCALLDGRDEVAAVELNVSCPNVASPSEAVEEIVAAARRATGKTLYAKLSPSLPDVGAAAGAAAAAGADGLSLVNTLRGLALDRALSPVLAGATGGLSGPALRPVALAAVHAAFATTGLPIVGMGGVETGRHALELIAAGASAVALGTVLFADPEAPARVRAELAAEADALGLASPRAAYGAAHAGGCPPDLRAVA